MPQSWLVLKSSDVVRISIVCSISEEFVFILPIFSVIPNSFSDLSSATNNVLQFPKPSICVDFRTDLHLQVSVSSASHTDTLIVFDFHQDTHNCNFRSSKEYTYFSLAIFTPNNVILVLIKDQSVLYNFYFNYWDPATLLCWPSKAGVTNSPLRLPSLTISKIIATKLNHVNHTIFFFFSRENTLHKKNRSLFPGPLHIGNGVENRKKSCQLIHSDVCSVMVPRVNSMRNSPLQSHLPCWQEWGGKGHGGKLLESYMRLEIT